MQICNNHNHDQKDCPACIESARIIEYLSRKNQEHVDLNTKFLHQMTHMQQIIICQKEEISLLQGIGGVSPPNQSK